MEVVHWVPLDRAHLVSKWGSFKAAIASPIQLYTTQLNVPSMLWLRMEGHIGSVKPQPRTQVKLVHSQAWEGVRSVMRVSSGDL